VSGPTTDPRHAVERLERAHRVLITSHRNPDGDALGSELALAALVRELGKEAVIVNRDPAPAGLAELPGADTILVRDTLPDDFPAAYDLVTVMECPGLDRAGFDTLAAVPILNIDHHADNGLYGQVNYLDGDSPAVGEMVWKMFAAAHLMPDAATATCCFAALSTDTGDFRYANATQRAFLAAAEMVAAGARPEQVSMWVHERRTEASVRLLAEVLATLEIGCGGRLAVIQADVGAFARAGAGAEDTEDIVNVPRTITGVEAVAFFKEPEPGTVRVSLRSRGSIDVRSVAAAFGGGGHVNAAGCSVEGSLETARERILPALRQQMECDS